MIPYVPPDDPTAHDAWLEAARRAEAQDAEDDQSEEA
jgi:hypothetical protein